MGIKEKFADAKAKYKQIKKAKEYYSLVKNLIDEDTRSQEIFKQGIKWSMKLGEKLVGASLTKHPYFTFHKAHLVALGTALSASDTHHNAMKALASAIASADSAAELAGQVDALRHRHKMVQLNYWHMVRGPILEIQRWNTGSAELRRDLTEAGMSATEFETAMDNGVMQVRSDAVELYLESVALLAMVDIEYRAASEAYKRFTAKIDKLQKSKSQIDRVAGLAAERDRQWEWYDRERALIDHKPTAAPEAVIDPSAYAKRQRDTVGELVEKLATMCDAVMSDEIYTPDKLLMTIGK